MRKQLALQSEFNRYEAKYIIPPSLVPQIRDFIAPFCEKDPHAEGDPPEYMITTLQLDSEGLHLHRAKSEEAINRFKMRIRTYGSDEKVPVFLEIKRKLRGSISKSRVMIPREFYNKELFCGGPQPEFRSKKEALAFFDFLRLREQMNMRPVVFVRYHRESYVGKNYHYARVTFDRKLCYRRTRDWAFPSDGDRWRAMDSTVALNRKYPGVILELKTFRDVPLWMSELTERFNLVRSGFCKYSTAMDQEARFYGEPYPQPLYEDESLLNPARIQL
ncbi:MAG: polyphosphate polymerase domain-containing protein [Kiritimatiellales bacterium]|nr:polyphosphate polymerase domain-containing protein [Kiritimatiellota bacterium]MBL7011374.1 polyphosphate polymerase domain-containing protein [Kiritimatiellales bacterium]